MRQFARIRFAELVIAALLTGSVGMSLGTAKSLYAVNREQGAHGQRLAILEKAQSDTAEHMADALAMLTAAIDDQSDALADSMARLSERITAIEANRFTSADALQMKRESNALALDHAEESLAVWKELARLAESKADSDDVPPPEVLRFQERIDRRLEFFEAEIGRLREAVAGHKHEGKTS